MLKKTEQKHVLGMQEILKKLATQQKNGVKIIQKKLKNKKQIGLKNQKTGFAHLLVRQNKEQKKVELNFQLPWMIFCRFLLSAQSLG